MGALADLRRVHNIFGALKKEAYRIQGLTPAELAATWDSLRAHSTWQYEEMEEAVRRFLGASPWQQRFQFYYVLPIVLHLAKLAVFCSSAGILGTLAFDVVVFATFTLLRHPYAVSMTVSYASDMDAFPHLIKVAVAYLAAEALSAAALERGFSYHVELDSLLVPRVDARPLYTCALCIYAAYALCHQAYTLYHERSWQHRRPLEVALSLISHQLNNVSYLIAFYRSYAPESVYYLAYAAWMCWKYAQHRGVVIQPSFYTSHRIQHMKQLYAFCHKYHHLGHPTTPMEAQEGGLMEFWAAHTGFLLGARTGWYGSGGVPTPLGLICRHLRVASAHGLWLGFLQSRTFHDLSCEGGRYVVAARQSADARLEGEPKGATIPCLHYYHHIIPDQQFSYDSFARLDLVFGTQHKVAEVLLQDCRAGTLDLP